MKIYKYSSITKTATLLYNGNILLTEDNKTLHFGDFNGDRKTDFLNISAKDIYLGTGTEFVNGNSMSHLITPSQFYLNYRTGDFNGDGKDDIIAWRDTDVDILYSLGNGQFEKQSYSLENACTDGFRTLYPLDYYGIGKKSLFIVNEKDSNSDGNPVVTLYKGRLFHVESITDSYNNKTD
ncbi:MAG: VCBS repeat-containing protein, partial [Bacteroidales bacterium]|nr:VCBS repeat-containing protein [Bacteroidales bacterium]